MNANESRALAAISYLVPSARKQIIRAEQAGQDPLDLFPFARNIDDATLFKLYNANSMLEFYANA